MEVAILPTTMAEATPRIITAEATPHIITAEVTPHIMPPVDITGDPTPITIRTHHITTDRIGVHGNIASPTPAIRTLTVPIIEPAVIMWILITIPQGMVMIVPDTGWIPMATMWTAADDTPEAGAVMINIMTN